MSLTEESTLVRETIIAHGRKFYEEQLKFQIEPEHTGRFIAVEPETGRYFLGDTDGEALLAAHEAMPESHFYVKRIGHNITHRLGSYGIRHG